MSPIHLDICGVAVHSIPPFFLCCFFSERWSIHAIRPEEISAKMLRKYAVAFSSFFFFFFSFFSSLYPKECVHALRDTCGGCPRYAAYRHTSTYPSSALELSRRLAVCLSLCIAPHLHLRKLSESSEGSPGRILFRKSPSLPARRFFSLPPK